MEYRKKYSIPSLDFSKIKKEKLQRRNSDSDIFTNRTSKRKDIDDVIEKHKEACNIIKEILNKLEEIKAGVAYDDIGISHAIKDIRDQLCNFNDSKTPRLISRCDAIIGNTQMIITNTKESLLHLKNIDEELEQHDMSTITILGDIYREIDAIKKNIQNLEKKIDGLKP